MTTVTCAGCGRDLANETAIEVERDRYYCRNLCVVEVEVVNGRVLVPAA